METSNDDINTSDNAAGDGGPSNSVFNQEVNGIRIRRFRMLCAIERNVRSESQFRYRANSVMVDEVGLVEHKRKKNIPRIAKAKARDMYNGFKLIAEHTASEYPSKHSKQWQRISKNMSDGVLTEKSLRDTLIRKYQAQEQPSTDVHSTQGDGGYSLDFLLGRVENYVLYLGNCLFWSI